MLNFLKRITIYIVFNYLKLCFDLLQKFFLHVFGFIDQSKAKLFSFLRQKYKHKLLNIGTLWTVEMFYFKNQSNFSFGR